MLEADKIKLPSVMMPSTFSVYEMSDGKTHIAMMNLELFGRAMGGDVVPAMEKAWPDMLKMIDFSASSPSAQPNTN